jgi:hypothetical protein
MQGSMPILVLKKIQIKLVLGSGCKQDKMNNLITLSKLEQIDLK